MSKPKKKKRSATKISCREELFDLIERKIKKSRKKARGIKEARSYPGHVKRVIFDYETKKGKITEESLLPLDAYKSLVSRRDIIRLSKEKLGRKKKIPVIFSYNRGITTVGNVLDFYYLESP